MRICTIVARNYLAHAEVLAESFHEHHPDGTVSVLVVDDCQRLVEGRPGLYEILRPEDLSIPRFVGMAAMYDVTELCTAVKPWLLYHLLQAGEPVAYFDPDICFYAPVDELVELAAEHQVVLIPHIASPLPDDGQRPDGMHILAAGAYNLGFIALGPGDATDSLLKWWSARLRFDCINDVRNDYFVDQRWFDLVPGMFPSTALLRDPGMNVAYWNLHERHLRVDDQGRRWIGAVPLRFFHFSGFDPRRPDEVSLHQTRVRLRDAPELAALFEEYTQRLGDHRSRTDASGWPFDQLADGRRLDHNLRRLYREGEREGAFQHSPFTVEGTEEFIAWLAAVPPDAPGSGINRYWTYVYRSRPELQGAFPVLAGADGERFLDWIVNHGAAEVESRGLLPPRADSERRIPDPVSGAGGPGTVSDDGTVWGVNVGGFLESELGTGEAARAVITALDAVRIPVLPVHGRWRPGSRQGHRFAMFDPRDAVFPVNLLCVNADMMEPWMAEAGQGFFADRYTIGLWWWEVTSWPERWLGAFDLVDEVWVATDHVRAALTPVATVPVTKITLPIDVPTPRPRTRADLGLPEGFLFFFMFDYASVVERKNPFDTVEAFTRAFAPGEGAKLVVKCINQDVNPSAHDRLRIATARHPDVEILEGYVSAADKNSMVASADCYVSLHRAEGFGLTLAESLLLGKPVIATRYSGNLDFMSPTGSWLVDAEMVPVGPGNDPYPADGEWAQPDVDQASRFMREIFGDPAGAVDRAARGAEMIRRTHSRLAAGEAMAARLELLRGRRAGWPNRRGQRPIVPDTRELEHASDLLARGPSPTRPNPGAARSLVRRSALRVMKPYTEFEQQVDHALIDAVHALDDRIGSQRQESEARFGGQIATVAATVRDLELSVAAVSAQAATIEQTAARFAATQAAVELLSDHLTGLHQHVETAVTDASSEIAEIRNRVRLAEVRLKQLETPPLTSDRARYVALAALHRAHAEVGNKARARSRTDALEGYELRGFSQNGEDGVLAEILSRIGAENRFFVEFGIENGREGNCVYLADRAGWEGLFIEADPEMYRELSDKYAEAGPIRTLGQCVTPENVERLFGDAAVPESFDILSIDVDGSDYWIWRAVEAYRPRVVVIEYNSALPADLALVQPPDHGKWDGTEFQGASLRAIERLGAEKGYQLVHTETSGVNAFFVREELAGGRFPGPDTVPRREPNYFQIGYHHPPDPEGRRYLDLESGELVRPPARRKVDEVDT